MVLECAEQIHDRAWRDYMNAWRKVRAVSGRGAFKAQQAFIEASARVERAQYYLVLKKERKAAKWNAYERTFR